MTKYKINSIEFIKEYINSDTDLNIKNNYNSTLLHYAIIHKQPEITKLLIESGANVNIGDDYNIIPLQYAIMYEQLKANIKEDRGNAVRWNKLFNIINGTKYGKGR